MNFIAENVFFGVSPQGKTFFHDINCTAPHIQDGDVMTSPFLFKWNGDPVVCGGLICNRFQLETKVWSRVSIGLNKMRRWPHVLRINKHKYLISG